MRKDLFLRREWKRKKNSVFRTGIFAGAPPEKETVNYTVSKSNHRKRSPDHSQDPFITQAPQIPFPILPHHSLQ